MARKIAWKERDENVLIGKRHTRIDGVTKASGRAKYTADIDTPGTLYARLLTADIPNGKIKELNITEAKKVRGVRAVHVFRTVGAAIRWEGTPIVAIAADRPEQAQEAVKKIDIEYEPAEHWVDEQDLAGAAKAGRTKPLGNNKKGDVAKGLKDAKVVHKGYYGIATISHMCMEPHGSHCEWTAKDVVNVHLSTQNVSGTGGQFAGPLGIPAANVSLTCDYIGGGFGSKFAADEWGVACAQLAKAAGKPVKLMLDRPTELKIAGTRPSGFIRITIGADADGKITAWDSEHWGTSGTSGGTARLSGIPYVFDFDNRNRKATGIITNCGPNRAWRAPPHPQLCAMTHVAIDDVAAKLGKNSYDVFMNNLDKTPRPEVYAEEMKIAAKMIDWKGNWHPHGKGGGRGAVKRGLGMALHMWGGRAHGAKCTVKVHPDGAVESSAGSQDLGTGTRTVIAITLAETFGLPISAVKVNIGTNRYVRSGPSGGSTTVGGVTGPNRRAGLQALWKIFDLVAKKYEVAADGLVAKDRKIWSKGKAVCTWKQACRLLGTGGLEVEGSGPKKDGLTSSGVGGVQMAAVAVDTDTGIVRVEKFVAVQDCGLIIDLLTAESQVFGGVIMGISYALSEERIMDNATGRYVNANLRDYKLPRIGDVGDIKVQMYQPDKEYDRGVIGLGEPPVISSGAAISNAVANATGVRVPVIPLTPKRVRDALKGGKS
ncbi:MAG: xanthine dehydrogenase family protein molybdopterin-binding subunit [Planctomycetaceae bacterium]